MSRALPLGRNTTARVSSEFAWNGLVVLASGKRHAVPGILIPLPG